MCNRRHISLAMVALALASGNMACFGVNQTTLNVQPIAPVDTSLPSDTPFPVVTQTIVPIPTETSIGATQTSASTEIPLAIGQVTILEINGFKDEADYWYFYGLARNDTDRTISDLQIDVKLLDSAGAEIYTYKTNSILYYLAPGENSPFSDFTTEPFPDGTTMQATIAGYNSTDDINRANLEFRDITLWADEFNDIYLAGEVFNGNPEPIEINAIAGTLIDETGKLVTASSAYPLLDYIEPDSTGPFVMMFDAPIGKAGELTNYSITADALITVPTSTYDISISDKQFQYQDIHGDFHLVGSSTNNMSEPMNIYLVAGAYDENGNCIDASSLYVPYFPVALNPGDTLPYDFTMWGAIDSVPEAIGSANTVKVFINWKTTYEASSQAFELTTKDDVHTFDGGIGVFTGTVMNNSGKDLTSTIVNVAIYDKSTGDLLATNYSFVTDTLANNGTGAYEVYLYPPEDIDIENINLVITALGQ
jgi:hypothetical protein